MALKEASFLETPRGKIAYRQSLGDQDRTGFIWLGGFHSDMLGDKATALHEAAEADNRSYLRFDYSGHGESEGAFADGTIGAWREDAIAALDQLTTGRVILVGSSMGGWISLLLALARPERVAGLLLLAPAPDFTEKLMWAQFNEDQKRQIIDHGAWTRPSPYDDEGYPITRQLIEDGAKWSILDASIEFNGPVRILQGALDEDVPPAHSSKIVDRLTATDVTWTLIKDGDHRLSRPQDIERMLTQALTLARQLDAASA